MKQLLTVLLFTTMIHSPAFAKLEAFSVLTKYCSKTELLKASKGAVHKVVSEFNGKDMHGFIIELDIDKQTKATLTKNLMDMGCYTKNTAAAEVLERINKPKHTTTMAENSYAPEPNSYNNTDDDERLMPEDLFADDGLSDELFNPDIN